MSPLAPLASPAKTSTFRVLDLTIYSPMCIALAAAIRSPGTDHPKSDDGKSPPTSPDTLMRRGVTSKPPANRRDLPLAVVALELVVHEGTLGNWVNQHRARREPRSDDRGRTGRVDLFDPIVPTRRRMRPPRVASSRSPPTDSHFVARRRVLFMTISGGSDVHGWSGRARRSRARKHR